jgi:hypothetical protein
VASTVLTGPSNSVSARTLFDASAGYDGLWAYSSAPQNANVSDSSASGGVEFTSDVAGYVGGIQFYKGTQDTGAHTGELWDSSGNLLATGTFSDESKWGWQQVDFSSPVPIAAGQTYTASYHDSSGYYPQDSAYFTSSGVNNAPLHAAAAINGVFKYGPSAFPTQVNQSSNYWVQPVFESGIDASPNAVTDLHVTAVSSYEVDLAWSNPDDAYTTFQIERSSDGGTTFNAIDQTAAGATSYQDLTVSDATPYQYKVVAVSPDGPSSGDSNIVTATTPQAILDTLTATGVSPTSIQLNWTDNSGGTASAAVWRSIDDSTWTQIATVPAGTSTYSDTGLTPDTIYYYYLSTSGPSATAVSNQTAGVTLPTAPTGLTATPVTGGQGDVQLAWTDTANDNDGYEILGSADGINFSVIGDVTAGTTTYDDLMAADGVKDYYEVEAFGLGGNSAPTAAASTTPVANIVTVDDTPTNGIDYQVVHDQTLTISNASGGVLSNDTDPNNSYQSMRIASYTQPTHGTLTLDGDGTFAYTPNHGYVGTDQFTYTATDDNNASSNTATVSINVTDQMPEASSLTTGLSWTWTADSSGGGTGGSGGTWEPAVGMPTADMPDPPSAATEAAAEAPALKKPAARSPPPRSAATSPPAMPTTTPLPTPPANLTRIIHVASCAPGPRVV